MTDEISPAVADEVERLRRESFDRWAAGELRLATDDDPADPRAVGGPDTVA